MELPSTPQTIGKPMPARTQDDGGKPEVATEIDAETETSS